MPEPLNIIMDKSIGWIVTTLLAAVLGYLIAKIKSISKTDHAMQGGMRSIMRRELKIMHRQHVIKGEPISIDDKDEASEIYSAYHDLGGNGTGTHMYNEIMELPITKA